MYDTATIEQTVCETVAEVLGITAADLAAEPVLAAHEWDSFSSLHTLAELENELGIRFDLRTFHTARTVADLVALVTVAEQAS